jgi:SUMO ligase MMS21 Smc5/6 complex component
MCEEANLQLGPLNVKHNDVFERNSIDIYGDDACVRVCKSLRVMYVLR